MKLTVFGAIPLTLVAAAGLFGLSGVHRFENAHHGTDAVIGQAVWLGFLIAALATIVLVAVALYRRRKLRHSGVFLAALLALGLAATAAASNSLQGASVTLTDRGPVLHGPTSWRPGHIRIAATSRLADQEVTLLRFRPGYSYADFLADGRKAQRHDAVGRAAVADVFAHTIFAGGIDLFRDQSATMTVSVKAGTYYLGEMTARPQLTPIHVAGAPSNATLRSAATFTATDDGYRVLQHDATPRDDVVAAQAKVVRPRARRARSWTAAQPLVKSAAAASPTTWSRLPGSGVAGFDGQRAFSPSSVTIAGTSSGRTTNVSSRMPKAIAKPN